MEPNSQLDALLDQSGVSRAGLATRINRLGDHAGITLRYDHTAVARWLRGQRPRGRVPELICEVLGEKLDRTLTLGDIGMGVTATGRTPACLPGAEGDGLNRFVERAASLWRSDQVHDEWPGPSLLTGAAAVAPVWEWENPPEDRDVSHRGATPVTESDVTVLHAARGHYEHLYRNAGGVATRARVVGFLNAEVAPCCAAATTTRPGANCAGPPGRWPRSAASAPTTPTRKAWPSATSTRHFGWARRRGTCSSAATSSRSSSTRRSSWATAGTRLPAPRRC